MNWSIQCCTALLCISGCPRLERRLNKSQHCPWHLWQTWKVGLTDPKFLSERWWGYEYWWILNIFWLVSLTGRWPLVLKAFDHSQADIASYSILMCSLMRSGLGMSWYVFVECTASLPSSIIAPVWAESFSAQHLRCWQNLTLSSFFRLSQLSCEFASTILYHPLFEPIVLF